jgi:hypothetical protein
MANVRCHFIAAAEYLIEYFITHHNVGGLNPAATWYGKKIVFLRSFVVQVLEQVRLGKGKLPYLKNK